MESLIVYPENKKQLAAIKAVMKAMQITFQQGGDVYPEHVLKGVKRGLQQAREGNLKPYTGINDLLKQV